MDRCVICRGSRRINLPTWPQIAVGNYDKSPPSADKIEDAHRNYPCPECTGMVDPQQVVDTFTKRIAKMGGDYIYSGWAIKWVREAVGLDPVGK